MPIFMDRHNVQGITAEEVATVHQEDLKVQDKYNCRALTYWFDEERGAAFCLIEAPDQKAVEAMHKDAHGLIPHQIIEVDSNIVEAFLGRIEDPEPSANTGDFELPVFEDSAFRSIMVAELKNANLLLSEMESKELFNDFNSIIKKFCTQYNGQVVQSTYDRFIAAFSSVSGSVDCAVTLQKHLQGQSEANISARIGINAGEPVTDNEEFFGSAIQLAKRLCYIASEGEVRGSSLVKKQYKREKLGLLPKEDVLAWMNPKEENFLDRLMDATVRIWNREGFKVGDLCREIGVSESQLYRRVTSLTEESPTEFMKQYRLKKAIELLEKQPENIARVAYETGFNNPSYFSKCFKKQFGLLPSEYRDRMD